MSVLRSSFRFRLGALLCMALLAVFAGVNLSRTMDRIQHDAGGPKPHAPRLLSGLSVEEAHDAVHDASGQQDDNPADHIPDGSHHHHHGDSGSGVILMTQSGIHTPRADVARHGMASERTEPDSGPQGQERPPRFVTTRV